MQGEVQDEVHRAHGELRVQRELLDEVYTVQGKLQDEVYRLKGELQGADESQGAGQVAG